jgi:4'-phosphopantetheinyl transferase
VAGNLRFNVSHSENLFVAAFATGADVGVDVETVRPEFVDEATVRFALSEVERSAMNASSDPVGYFFGCWTRKEALIKASGEGFLADPSQIDSESLSNGGFKAVPLALFDRARSALACQTPSPATAVFRFPENLEARAD